jgi:hypothetical protein
VVLVAESAECWLLRAAGDKGERTERQAAASKTWQPKDRDGAGVKPRSREAAPLGAGLYARRQPRWERVVAANSLMIVARRAAIVRHPKGSWHETNWSPG